MMLPMIVLKRGRGAGGDGVGRCILGDGATLNVAPKLGQILCVLISGGGDGGTIELFGLT